MGRIKEVLVLATLLHLYVNRALLTNPYSILRLLSRMSLCRMSHVICLQLWLKVSAVAKPESRSFGGRFDN
jgi:hypothetical protein